ncbi:ABC transporter ATP-binding protein [uncultured Sneathiella sp.]|uniref:ABC transporter ATP-binding protein n=1 Tax=uncultured Sneathiella sp. TaxID=879315 RepID=UPI00259670F1|nr:ABC transporter ATP-binding protein [uncultured Sneathiella sp.]
MSAMLLASDISIRFGGVQALKDVSFDVSEGEVFAVIGPNGAGKTTLFNCLTAAYRPDSGSITFRGKSLNGVRRRDLAGMGIARTFQNLGLFDQLDAAENILLGRHNAMRSGFAAAALRLGSARREEREHRERVAEIVDILGLGAQLGVPSALLPYGARKLIEIGRALAMDPTLLLLDEPVAGLNREETGRMAEIISEIRRRFSTTILLVEHDMGFLMRLADRVLVLDYGRPIALGTPAEVQSDPAVVAAYLGTEGFV